MASEIFSGGAGDGRRAPLRSIDIRRSELTCPAHSRRMMESAARSQADLVMLDLEDACAVSQKVAARGALIGAANELDWSGKVLAVRPNDLGTPFFFDDLFEVLRGAGGRVQCVVMPKVGGGADVAYVDRLLGHLEQKFGLAPGAIRLEVLIETAQALERAQEIAHASRRLAALIFGVADFSADIGATLEADTFDSFVYAKQRTVAAAKSAGLLAIDCVTLRVKDLELCRRDAERARRLGFDGKWAIHPTQVPVIHQAFTPTPERVARARRIIEAYGNADAAEGKGAIVLGDEMVDRATIRVEERILALARKAGLLEDEPAPASI